ncbi:MAG TPA: NAD+ synthase [bacterium]|nr:NAD+ synthase [bacterium]HQG46521.1 NAD+ synthase [bacterium]HQI48997.1 NAD+ synthase [bacterium]HQJ65080.1 NAD+ synthase [bacterium]
MAESLFRLALAQINPVVGDLQGNGRQIAEKMAEAARAGCDLVAFPELALTGYPPEDLLLRRQFIADQREQLQILAAESGECLSVVGVVDEVQGRLFNAAAVLHRGGILGVYHKVNLPNYSVFDEERYFEAGRQPLVLDLGTLRIGLSICEDIWIEESVVEAEALEAGADLLLNISASPFYSNKGEERLALMQARARRCGSIVAYVNLVGGQDELVFDGRSLVVAADGRLLAAGGGFQEDFLFIDWPVREFAELRRARTRLGAAPITGLATALLLPLEWNPGSKPELRTAPRNIAPVKNEVEEIYQALLLGIRDYTRKNGFDKVTLGLSGGIDSALVAVLAADALGPDRVVAVTMPSQYSSGGSVTDSEELARNLGIDLLTLPVAPTFQSYLETLKTTFAGKSPDLTEENLQARIRGNLLMALSNKFGWMVLVTGNKSEVSVGYCTIYGDMAGGFSPLKDVYKTMVYALSEYRNKLAGRDLIPRAIIDKAPSAELRPNQTDQQSLPPYDLLDAVLEMYVEKEMGAAEIIAQGFDAATVRKVARLVDLAEYKRRQAAPGIKITPRAFGKDRRMPITNRYRGV